MERRRAAAVAAAERRADGEVECAARERCVERAVERGAQRKATLDRGRVCAEVERRSGGRAVPDEQLLGSIGGVRRLDHRQARWRRRVGGRGLQAGGRGVENLLQHRGAAEAR